MPDSCLHGHCLDHSAHKRAISAHDNRLDTHGEEIDEIKECIARLTLLAEKQQHWQEKADNRIHELEKVPAQRWHTSVNTVLTGVISALVGAVIALMGSGVIGGV